MVTGLGKHSVMSHRSSESHRNRPTAAKSFSLLPSVNKSAPRSGKAATEQKSGSTQSPSKSIHLYSQGDDGNSIKRRKKFHKYLKAKVNTIRESQSLPTLVVGVPSATKNRWARKKMGGSSGKKDYGLHGLARQNGHLMPECLVFKNEWRRTRRRAAEDNESSRMFAEFVGEIKKKQTIDLKPLSLNLKNVRGKYIKMCCTVALCTE